MVYATNSHYEVQKPPFGLLSLLRRVSRLSLIFDAGTFTHTSLSLRSHILRWDQHEVLPRLRMGKPTVDVIITTLTERKLWSQFRRCDLWLQQATPSEPCNHSHKAHQQTRSLEIECHGAITRGQE
jgi:hypothetical protein